MFKKKWATFEGGPVCYAKKLCNEKIKILNVI